MALEQFLDRDYEDVSVDDVAAKAGVSHGLVFQYFGSKKDLYIASLEPLLTGFQDRARAAPRPISAPSSGSAMRSAPTTTTPAPIPPATGR